MTHEGVFSYYFGVLESSLKYEHLDVIKRRIRDVLGRIRGSIVTIWNWIRDGLLRLYLGMVVGELVFAVGGLVFTDECWNVTGRLAKDKATGCDSDTILEIKREKEGISVLYSVNNSYTEVLFI